MSKKHTVLAVFIANISIIIINLTSCVTFEIFPF